MLSSTDTLTGRMPCSTQVVERGRVCVEEEEEGPYRPCSCQ
jgi:hypothetical protein